MGKTVTTEIKIAKGEYKLYDLLVLTNMASSLSQARRLIQTQMVRVNGEFVTDFTKIIPIRENETTKLQIGKKKIKYVEGV